MKIINIINGVYNYFYFCFNKNFLIVLLIVKNIILIILIYYFDLNIEMNSNNNNKKIIEIDNALEFPKYEDNISFSNYSSELKPIAIYYPQIIDINNNDLELNKLNENFFNFNKTFLFNKIRNSVTLAKNHGIYGFGIYYIYNNNLEKIINKEIDLFLNNHYIDFPFLLIWKTKYFIELLNLLKVKFISYKKLLESELDKFVKNVKRYLKSKLYIKYKHRPILSIEHSYGTKNLKKVILMLRKKMIENKIGKIFILYSKHDEYNISKNENLFDGIYDKPKIFSFNNDNQEELKIFYYSGLIYKILLINEHKKKPKLFLCSMLEIKNKFFKYYSPSKYYLLNKVIINWTKENYKETNGIFIIDSWNNFEDGSYIEPDENYGYASLNAFSRALFNLPFKEDYYNLIYLQNRKIISIQVHLFYIDLLPEIISKTNNIPLRYDLYITINFPLDKEYVEENLKIYSNADKYEVLIVENRGRDVLPFFIQMKDKIKKYKYICHIHTKKSQHNPILGNEWRHYLYDNLLGNKNLISEIIYDFEIYDKLGFICADTYYNNVKGMTNFEYINCRYHEPNIKYMNFILKRLFGKFKVGTQLIFPDGDMFWAKVEAIYQIFSIDFKKKYPKENNQINGTFMHAIERIWLYIVKLNGYYYKIIFNYY